MLLTRNTEVKEITLENQAEPKLIVQFKELSGWVALCGENNGAFERCYRCDENGNDSRYNDGEQSNEFSIKPLISEFASKCNNIWIYKLTDGHIFETPEEKAEKERRHKAWQEEQTTVTLTNDQWGTLTTYILMTTKYREDEVKTWLDLAKNKDENGEPFYKNAPSNAKFWQEMTSKLDAIRETIDNR